MYNGGNNLLDFTDRVVVMTGTSSGMGAAALEQFGQAGALVHAVDINPPAVDQAEGPDRRQTAAVFHHCDIGDRDALDRTIAELPARIDVLVNCAGIPNGGRFSAEQVMRVNWLGLRHLTEAVLPRMNDGGSIVHIASTAGRDWADRTEDHEQLMAASTFDEGLAWIQAKPGSVGDGYVFSKQAVQYYTLWRSVQLLPHNIRMNSICPGITDTSIIGDFRRGMGDDIIDHAQAVAGRIADPREMVPAMLFLADDNAASYITGINLNIDRGTGAARLSNQADPERIWGAG